MVKFTRRSAVVTGLVASSSILLPRFAKAAEFNWKIH